MKVAISSSGNTASSTIDQRFGRCAYFAFYDTETKELEFLANPSLNAEEAAVAFVANKQVSKIISGEFGFKIKGLLNDLNIQMVMIKDNKTIQEIIDLLNQQ